MSKYVKNLVTEHLRNRLRGVDDALLVNVIGLDANASNRLRGELEAKQIHLVVVKNSLAARAMADAPLGAILKDLAGSVAICFGGEDIVSLAKEIVRLAEDEKFSAMKPRGGVMDGEALTGAQVVQVSKWPSRGEQLGRLVAQILGPGATLAAQILGPGGTLAGQVAEKAKSEDTPQPAAE